MSGTLNLFSPSNAQNTFTKDSIILVPVVASETFFIRSMGLTSMNVIPGLECNEIEGSLQTTQSTHASKTFTKKIVGFKKGMEPKIIFAQQNKFTSFEGMPQLVNLEQIFLDNNQIINFVGIPYLKNLHILTLENNNITSFCGAELLPNLEQLNLKGNPITEYIPEDAHEQSDKAYRVMAFIAFGSNKLKRIDNEILSLCERDDGERIMQYVQDNIRQGYLLRHIYNEPLNSLERAKGQYIAYEEDLQKEQELQEDQNDNLIQVSHTPPSWEQNNQFSKIPSDDVRLSDEQTEQENKQYNQTQNQQLTPKHQSPIHQSKQLDKKQKLFSTPNTQQTSRSGNNQINNSNKSQSRNKIDPQFEVSGYVDLLWKKDSIKELKVMKKHPYHIRGKMDRISPFVVPGKWTEQSLLKEQKERQIKQKCKQQKERLSGWEGNEEIIQDENITKQDDPNNTIVQIKDDDQLENEEIQRNKERNEFNDDYEQTQHIYVAEEDLHDTDILFLKKMRDVMDATKQLLTIEDDIFKQEQDNEQNKSTEIKEIKHLRGLQGKLCAHPAVFDALGINLIRLTDESSNIYSSIKKASKHGINQNMNFIVSMKSIIEYLSTSQIDWALNIADYEDKGDEDLRQRAQFLSSIDRRGVFPKKINCLFLEEYIGQIPEEEEQQQEEQIQKEEQEHESEQDNQEHEQIQDNQEHEQEQDNQEHEQIQDNQEHEQEQDNQENEQIQDNQEHEQEQENESINEQQLNQEDQIIQENDNQKVQQEQQQEHEQEDQQQTEQNDESISEQDQIQIKDRKEDTNEKDDDKDEEKHKNINQEERLNDQLDKIEDNQEIKYQKVLKQDNVLEDGNEVIIQEDILKQEEEGINEIPILCTGMQSQRFRKGKIEVNHRGIFFSAEVNTYQQNENDEVEDQDNYLQNDSKSEIIFQSSFLLLSGIELLNDGELFDGQDFVISNQQNGELNDNGEEQNTQEGSIHISLDLIFEDEERIEKEIIAIETKKTLYKYRKKRKEQVSDQEIELKGSPNITQKHSRSKKYNKIKKRRKKSQSQSRDHQLDVNKRSNSQPNSPPQKTLKQSKNSSAKLKTDQFSKSEIKHKSSQQKNKSTSISPSKLKINKQKTLPSKDELIQNEKEIGKQINSQKIDIINKHKSQQHKTKQFSTNKEKFISDIKTKQEKGIQEYIPNSKNNIVALNSQQTNKLNNSIDNQQQNDIIADKHEIEHDLESKQSRHTMNTTTSSIFTSESSSHKSHKQAIFDQMFISPVQEKDIQQELSDQNDKGKQVNFDQQEKRNENNSQNSDQQDSSDNIEDLVGTLRLEFLTGIIIRFRCIQPLHVYGIIKLWFERTQSKRMAFLEHVQKFFTEQVNNKAQQHGHVLLFHDLRQKNSL